MQCTVEQIYRLVDQYAPFSLALPEDHVGLLVGDAYQPVDTVLIALDATMEVVREAEALGAQVLLTHHPVMRTPLKRLVVQEPEGALLYAMARAGLSMIAAHTNLDRVAGGVNDELARILRFSVDSTDGFLRIGVLPQPQTLGQVGEWVHARLGGILQRFGAENMPCKRFAICGGSAGSQVVKAAEYGVDVLICGECKYHDALVAQTLRMGVVTVGHAESEKCAVELLQNHLQTVLNVVEWNVRIYKSKVDPFA